MRRSAAMDGLDIDRLRAELFLTMVRAHGANLQSLRTEDATLMAEHAARLAKAALDGVGYFDRTGEVRSPVREDASKREAKP